MRTTKALLCAAAVAAGAVSAMAQSNVYSLNVVGYVNQTYLAGKSYLVGPPLVGTNNTLNELFGALPRYSSVSMWTGSNYSSVSKGLSGFVPNSVVPMGTGVFVKSVANVTNTFVGNVVTGTFTNTVANGSWIYSDPVPVTEGLTNIGIEQVIPRYSSISRWNGSNYTSISKGLTGFVPEPIINVGEAFFIKNLGQATNVVRTFNVQ